MYDFYSSYLKDKYGDKCQLLYADTNSFLLDIETEDIYKDTAED